MTVDEGKVLIMEMADAVIESKALDGTMASVRKLIDAHDLT
jgi:hypothetical protein